MKTQELNALAPCPFCGGSRLESGGDDKFVGVRCIDCDATGPNHYITGREWNTRAAATSQASVNAMREACKNVALAERERAVGAKDNLSICAGRIDAAERIAAAIDNIEVQASVETATPVQEVVVVKPLRWVAGKVFGSYKWRGICAEFGEIASFVDDELTPAQIAEKKASIQADYEQRIRSALVVAPAPSGTEALREALGNIRCAILEAPTDVIIDTVWMPDRLFKGGTVVDYIDEILSTPAPAQQAVDAEAVEGQAWSAHTHDEMMPNSTSLYCAFKQFANELHALALIGVGDGE